MQFEAEVRDLTSDGRGVISTPDGQTCFVAGVWPEEQGTFRIIKSQSKIPQAELVELQLASSFRREAPCRFHGHSKLHCGGCAWQFVSYEAQLMAKQKRVVTELSRIQTNINILPIKASEQEFNYRNRAQFKTNGHDIGFEAAQTNELVPIDNCVVLTEKNSNTLKELVSGLPRFDWKVKSLKSRKKNKTKWTTLDIDENTDAKSVAVNRRLPFRQGNSTQNSFMQNWMREHLSHFSGEKTALELFCGSGNFTEILAEYSWSKVYAAELDASAIRQLNERNLKGVNALCINLYQQEALSTLLSKAREAQVLVLDPPRDGMKEIGFICSSLRNLEKIFYISCNLATFCRDAKTLAEYGFEIEEVQAVDMFPQTPHVELLAVFHSK